MIGQERLRVDPVCRSAATLERLSSLIDWQPVAGQLAPSSLCQGRARAPPLSMFKPLLQAIWNDLFDE
ncbi:hypothetical protein [Roseomonas sp. HF4]|uniref:hypothetical protein n=1 Tax=Roseomonas sp. HF4 TaxID=2562313 RepID=UPI0010BFC8C9|nr:hypothetical protein [Roseomonas sp. HF4]